ncbi:MAG: nucleotide exchange factor GrpE [Desulfobacterales bacterium]|nr:nucleotide exchange factor GrpE [Desulfobacterales bacterium]
MIDTDKEAVSGESSETDVAKNLDGDASKQAKKKPPRKKTLKERLKAAEAKAEEDYNRLLRVTADFENYKKRMEREMNDFRKFANEALIKEILPIVDNLERAVTTPCDENSEEQAFHGMHQGVEMTLKGLMDSLRKFGVTQMETLEKPFDPNFHQAISQVESGQHPENTILKEFQKGYMLGGRLLRPAMVTISKKPDTKVEVKSKSSEDEPKTNITIQ